MAERKEDVFANIYQLTLTESAPVTLTFVEINMGLTLFQKKAILISRIVIDWGWVTMQALVEAADSIMVGLTASDQLESLALRDSACIWKAQKGIIWHGTPANAEVVNVVNVYDLSGIPGGGEFVVPSPLYGAIHGASLVAAQSVTMRIYFQIVELKPEEYFELLESRHFFG
ncbi:hypothetical protein ES705_42918 [subsurface metagenome]